MFNSAPLSLACRRRAAGLVALAASLSLLAGTADAAMSRWAENEGGRMRIIALAPEADGTVQGALQIEPKDGWITYWKEPGEAGIPPQITLSPGHGITLKDISFPVPKPFETGNIRDLGYDHPVTLPFTLTLADPSQPLKLNASAFIGLCRNICIPFQAEFELDLSTAKGLPLEENLILDKAARSLPERPTPDFAVARHGLSDDLKTLRLAVKLPQASEAPQIYVAGPDGHVLFDQENARRTGGLYEVEMPVGKLPKGYDPKGKSWDILVVAGSRAMETSLAFD
ncbi:protein-disulfide reductase DsbD domain-containing protein [Allorhizobium pseudoryzae]|jgi:DsbC/DsbD-like thiol-disulfide interchange protein|uniref:protein-disulfide reductase DsbD domain-containing protein n=1 Tax=Allorhizobium pseudoryzae TaxID=379684 RepID=UPI003D0163D4